MNTVLNGAKKFHKHHGSNVVLEEGDTVACRNQSYANAVVFGAAPLLPNELFLLEIKSTERGWAGDMRIGLTTVNPNVVDDLPQFALPDLSSIRPSWIYAITKSSIFNRKRRPLYSQEIFFRTEYGMVPLRSILPHTKSASDKCATDVGSQIGVVYVPISQYSAELHFIVNGVDQGIFASDIPYSNKKLFVVVDIYGCTKKVSIVQLRLSVSSLQEICRETILQTIAKSSISKLPLPNALKDYLLKS